MGKSYKTFYCHNTHLVEQKGWPTKDKKGTVVINDWKNKLMFQINFGKNPEVFIFPTDDVGNINGGCRLEETLNVLAKRKADIAIDEFYQWLNDIKSKPIKPTCSNSSEEFDRLFHD